MTTVFLDSISTQKCQKTNQRLWNLANTVIVSVILSKPRIGLGIYVCSVNSLQKCGSELTSLTHLEIKIESFCLAR